MIKIIRINYFATCEEIKCERLLISKNNISRYLVIPNYIEIKNIFLYSLGTYT